MASNAHIMPEIVSSVIKGEMFAMPLSFGFLQPELL